MLDQIITPISDLISLILILASAILLLRSLYKFRSFNTLQARLAIFISIFATGEVPNILGDMGFMDIGPYKLIGSSIHTLSMVILAIFIAYRWRIYVMKEVVTDEEFDNILLEAVNNGLRKLLDENLVKVFKFYADVSIAVENPKKFSEILNKMFGDTSSVIMSSICEEIGRLMGIEDSWKNYEECVDKAKMKYYEARSRG